jgi:hypothetical protein
VGSPARICEALSRGSVESVSNMVNFSAVVGAGGECSREISARAYGGR